MNLDSKIPSGPLAQKWDKHKFDMKLVNPANKRKFDVIVVGSGLAGASAAATHGGTGLQGEMLLFPGQPAARAQHRGAGRHQRRQELSERRRQRLPAFLRHDQGRRFPRARSECLSAGAGEREHHRPMRGAGRAVRARIRRVAGEPLLRRRAGVAHVLRARPDRPAIVARRLSGACAGRSALGDGEDVSAHGDARCGGDRRPREGHHRARSGHGRNFLARGGRGGAGDRRLRQCFFSFDQRQGLQCHRDLARLQEGRGFSPIPATRRFIRPAFPSAAIINPS